MFKKPAFVHYAKSNVSQAGPMFPWISTDFASAATEAGGLAGVGGGVGGGLTVTSGGLPSAPGVWYDIFGNQYLLSFLQTGTLALGNVGQAAVPATSTTAAGSTVQGITWAAGGLTINAEIGNLLYVEQFATVAASTHFLKPIKANTATFITVSLTSTRVANNLPDPDQFPSVPTNALPVAIIRPNNVVIYDSANVFPPTGVAVNVVTAATAPWFFRQVVGLAGVSVSGNATVFQALNPSAVTPGITTPGAAAVHTVAYAAQAFTGAAAGVIPGWLVNERFS